MINKFDYTFGVVLFILVWDLRAYYKNVLQQNLTRKQQEWVNNMRYPHLYKFTNLVSIVAGIGFLIFYIFFNFGYAYFYPLGAVLVLHFFKDFIRNIQKKESSTYKDGRNISLKRRRMEKQIATIFSLLSFNYLMFKY